MTQALHGKRFDRQSQYRDRLAAQLIGQGMDTSPVQHWAQGAARLAQALAGGMIGMKQDQRYAEREKQSAEAMANLFAPSQQFVPSAAGAGPRPGAQVQTAQPTLAEIAQRAAAHPATAHLAPQFQMQDIQNQQALAQRGTWRAAEQNGLKGQVNSATGEFKPDPMPRASNQPRFTFQNVNGQIVAIDQSDPSKQMPIGPAGTPEAPKPEGGPFSGNAMDAQAWNIVSNPNADRSSPAYIAAHAYLTQPKLQMVPGPDGTPQMSQVTPNIPFPGPNAAQQAAPQTVPQQSPAAPPTAPEASAMPPAVNTGSMTVQPIAPAKAPQLTEGQANAALYADRIREALPVIERFGNEGLSVRNRVASSIPGVGNSLVTPEFQQLDQAQRNFINAVLRRESGAVISPQEFDNAAKQYFPQIGDSPEVIAQKKANRESALSGIGRAAGPAYKPVSPPIGGGAVADPELPPGFKVIK